MGKYKINENAGESIEDCEFMGDFKIVRNRGPFDDNEWHLFNIRTDPGETTDLKAQMPDRFEKMLSAYGRYVADNKVLPIPEGYTKQGALKTYGKRQQLMAVKENLPVIAAVGILVINLLGLAVRHRRQKRKNT